MITAHDNPNVVLEILNQLIQYWPNNEAIYFFNRLDFAMIVVLMCFLVWRINMS